MTKLEEKLNIPSGWTHLFMREVLSENINTALENKNLPVLTSARTGIFLQESYFKKIVASKDRSNYKRINKGQFTYRSMSDDGTFKINRLKIVDKGLVSPAYSVFYATKANPDFLEYYFDSRILQNDLRRHIQGGTRLALKFDNLLKVKILLPSKSEQKKIAEIFGVVDEDIIKTQKVVEASEKLKRGLMQQLFTDGTRDTIFILRKLVEVANISTGTTPSTSKKEYYEGKNPFIKTGEIVNERIERTDVFISDKAIQDYRLKRYQPGTILLAMYGQGKTRGQTALLKIEACTTQNAAAIEPNKEIDPEYLWLFLKSQYELLRGDGVRGHISHLNLSYMKSYEIPVPPMKEQRHIAEILSTVDEKISINKELKIKLTFLKKCLMQDLLSGRVRTT